MGPFAIDNGYYQAKNVTFSRERSVGPGNTYVHAEKNMATAQHSAKIASNQPYAAGLQPDHPGSRRLRGRQGSGYGQVP